MEFKTEFNLKDRVWYMKNNKPVEVVIASIEIFHVDSNQSHIKYSGKDEVNPVSWQDHTNLFEGKIYHSKNELLESL